MCRLVHIDLMIEGWKQGDSCFHPFYILTFMETTCYSIGNLVQYKSMPDHK